MGLTRRPAHGLWIPSGDVPHRHRRRWHLHRLRRLSRGARRRKRQDALDPRARERCGDRRPIAGSRGLRASGSKSCWRAPMSSTSARRLPPTRCSSTRAPCVGMLTTKGFRDVIDLRRGYKESLTDIRLAAPHPIVAAPAPDRRQRAGRPRRNGAGPARRGRGARGGAPGLSDAGNPLATPCAFSRRMPIRHMSTDAPSSSQSMTPTRTSASRPTC